MSFGQAMALDFYIRCAGSDACYTVHRMYNYMYMQAHRYVSHSIVMQFFFTSAPRSREDESEMEGAIELCV